MTTYTWTGGVGDEWTQPASWSPSGGPGTADTAIIPSGALVDVFGRPPQVAGSETVAALVNHGDLDIDPDNEELTQSLTVTRSLANAGTIDLATETLKTTGSFVNTGTILGSGWLNVAGGTMRNAGGVILASSESYLVPQLRFAGELDGGTLDLLANSTLVLAPGWDGGPDTVTATIGSHATLCLDVIDTGGTFSQAGTLTIPAFLPGETIVIDGMVGGGTFPDITATANGDTLTLAVGGQTIGALLFGGGTSNLSFSQVGNYGVVTASPWHWVGGSGNFNTAADWSPKGIPGATDDVVIDAPGTYTVTASTDETVNSLAMAPGAVLVLSAGTFTASNGYVTGALAGSVSMDAGAVLAMGGPGLANTGTLAGAGTIAITAEVNNFGTVNANGSAGLTIDFGDLQLDSPYTQLFISLFWGRVETTGAGGLTITGGAVDNGNLGLIATTGPGGMTLAGGAFTNAGTVNGGGSAGLTIDPGSANGVVNLAAGLVEATRAGGLAIASGTVSNAGTMLAANGGALTFQPAAVNTNNTGGLLIGGTWEATGSGSTLSITGGAMTQDKATIILSGAGSTFRAGDGSTFSNLEASLVGVAPIGAFDLLAGRSFAATHGIAGFGMIELGGGTLTLPRLALGASGHVRGYGTLADTRYPISNGGTIEAHGGTLAVATAVDPTSSGVFVLDAASVLEIAADQGAADTMKFLGAGAGLIIDDAGKFGLNVGTSAYTGPLVQNFGSGNQIVLKDLAPTGLTPLYDATTGILQVSNGSTNVATLAFANASLGTGSFHLAGDEHGHALVTHS